MSKNNYSVKNFKKIILSIFSSIIDFFNKFKFKFKQFKIPKIILDKENKVFALIFLLVLFFSYFLFPVLHDKKEIKILLQNQLFKKFDINFRLSDDINYRLYPKPHFLLKNSNIIENDNSLANIKKMKIFISSKNLFSEKNIKIKDIILNDTNFSLNSKNLNFLFKLVNYDPVNNKIKIRNSNIFYKDLNGDVLFINKIFNTKVFYDYKNLTNVLIAKNKIFNIPFTVNVQNDSKNKKLVFNLNAQEMRLNIENKFNYKDSIKKGSVVLSFINSKFFSDYQLRKDSLDFFSTENSFNQNIIFTGLVNFKPFYTSISINLARLDFSNLLDTNSIIIEFLKSELLNHKNLNLNIDIKTDELVNYNKLSDLLLKIEIKDSLIDLKGTQVNWDDNVSFNFKDSVLRIENNNIILDSKIIMDIKNSKKIYKFFKTTKKSRSEIKKIELDFSYNFIQKSTDLKDIKIDNKNIPEVYEFFNKFNLEKNRFNNKIEFKNFINKFFKVYAG